jgi:hypothetical protein
MTRLAKPEKKAGKGNERRGMYANQSIKAIGCRPLNSRDTSCLETAIRQRLACTAMGQLATLEASTTAP